MKIVVILISIIVFTLSMGCGRNTSMLDTPPPDSAVKATVNEISPVDALPKIQAAYSQFVDVRSPEEYAAGHAVRAINIPLESLADNFDRIERNEPVYLICNTGKQSAEAGKILSKAGFKWVFNVSGGTAAWKDAGLPMELAKH